jgi:hypothetical protein
MAYDLYPAVDETYDFPPEIRQALARSLELRNDVEPMTTAIRNNLLAAELWDGRTIANTTTDRLERYDAGTLTWMTISETADLLPIQQSNVGPTGFRNVFRNGDMQIAQRGNGPYAQGGVVGIDGFLNYSQGGTSVQTTRLGPVPGVSEYMSRTVVSGQSASTDCAQMEQHVENVATLAGKTATFSFLARALSGTPKLAFVLVQSFGVSGSAQVTTYLPPITISTTLTKYSMTFTVPSIVGKTVGANSWVGITVVFSAGSGQVHGGGIGIQNNTFDITDIQFEAGPIATPFERLPVQQQLAWCMRYFQQYIPAPPLRGVVAAANTPTNMGMALPVPMRVAPTFTSSGAARVYDGVGIGSVSTWMAIYTYSQMVAADAILTTAALVVGRPAVVLADTGAIIALSAEL